MRDPIEYVENFYDQQAEHEWERMQRHRTEFALTLRALEEHLPPPPARILDCGGGPGRYSIELSRRGYEVTLFDLSAENLSLAGKRSTEAGVEISRYEKGTATDLSRFGNELFDAVLLMGPLYHILKEEERVLALKESSRVLAPGGPLLGAFITRYAPLRYTAINEPDWPCREPKRMEGLLQDGLLPPSGSEDLEFLAYFAAPEEVEHRFWQQGLEVRSVLALEGLVSMIEGEVNALTGAEWEAWVDLNWRVATDPSLRGGVEHLLVVAVKPRWRQVLRHIAQRLSESGIRYWLTGSACAALHGVPLPVNDIDLVVGFEDLERCLELFAEYIVEPPVHKEKEAYRMQVRNLEIDGVAIEVLSGTQRRKGEQWIDAVPATRTEIELDGISVAACWLEEETLEYVRRGRLERAALCLRHCDQERLAQLM